MQIVDHGTWQLTAADEDLHPRRARNCYGTSRTTSTSPRRMDLSAATSGSACTRTGTVPGTGPASCGRGSRPCSWPTTRRRCPRRAAPACALPRCSAARRSPTPLASARLSLDATRRGAARTRPRPTATWRRRARPASAWTSNGAPSAACIRTRTCRGTRSRARCHGTVRLGEQTLAISGWGERDHSWGERDWWQVSWLWSSGRLGDGTAFHGMQANIGFAIPWPSFAVTPDGELRHLQRVRGGNLVRCRTTSRRSPGCCVPGAPMMAVPLAFAPVAMTSPDGRAVPLPARDVPVHRGRRPGRIRLDRVESAARLARAMAGRTSPRHAAAVTADRRAVGGGRDLTAGFLTRALADSPTARHAVDGSRGGARRHRAGVG